MNDNDVKKTLANRIREERKKKQWSQAKLAGLLGLSSNTTIGNWEAAIASPDLEKLDLMANLFGVSVDYLMGRASNGSDVAENGLDADSIKARYGEYFDLFDKFIKCDDIVKNAMEAFINENYKRITSTPRWAKKAEDVVGVHPLFLVEGRDEAYEDMKAKIPMLKTLKKKSKKGNFDIAQYLWEIGYGDEICVAFIGEIFGLGLNKRVPSQRLYNDIEEFLNNEYVISPKKDKKYRG